MLSSALSGLFRRSSAPPPLTQRPAFGSALAAAATALSADNGESQVQTPWPADRLALTNQLWGAGFIFPGGETETLRLARPLGMSATANLLLVGVGAGGPASGIARNLGATVTAMDNDPSLLAAARGLITRSQLRKKVTIKPWDPDNPVFDGKSYLHCLALEPFHNACPEPILDGLVRSLKPGGQLVVTALAAEVPLKPTDPAVRRWAELEHRDPANLLAPVAVSRMLGRVGLDVRAAEDLSKRHLDHAIVGWRALLHDLGAYKPTPGEAARLVAEAELWRLRQRMLRDGRLRMMRWHAIRHAHIV